ncbi:MAG: flippase-like domain-containing protein [Cyanobacteria bacterium K_DeepCast_150m_m2_101]|nr:flippase-like domain-containing protein [Cyanobacteria bacterium M_surface_9_m1_291]MBM5819733.1 flippase-like domain-containing protein [Cyanobacteria bacterium K_DeepCast_150m_m2_101]
MKALILLAGGLLVYGLLGLAVGWGRVAAELGALPSWIWPLAVLVVVAGYGLLFGRWQLLLRSLGHPLAAQASSAIYLAGLGLIAAPARSGEALRGLWLQRRHGIPLRIGVAATAAERLLDLASALLVLAWGLGLARQRAALAVVLLILIAGAWLLSHPASLARLEQQLLRLPLTRPWRGVRRVLWEGLQAMAELRSLLKPGPLLLGLALTTAVWIVEAALLQLVLQQLGAGLELQQAAVVRTATSLGGVLSLLPAGLGTSELTSVGLAMLYGASQGEALAATVVLRAATLLLPALMGVIALLLQPDLQRLRQP